MGTERSSKRTIASISLGGIRGANAGMPPSVAARQPRNVPNLRQRGQVTLCYLAFEVPGASGP